ncbi:hypothetical protein [Cohnella abietis]|uniref:hypothetical protein n=1 Tax=Cohnella abietis TaxID=2507935 RepID=UPI00102ECA8C|nr:hypothetical protein [Cohnella abietis]
MRISIGYFIIIFSYYFLSLILDSSFSEKLGYSNGIVYFILFLLGLLNGILSVFSKKKHFYLYWIAVSIIPEAIFMIYAKNRGDSTGLMPLTWDWGLWELFIPIIYAITQGILLTIVFVVGFRNPKNSNI